MNPSASFGPMTSTTFSPIIISMRPDWTIYMHSPGSPRENTTFPAPTVILAPALRANCRMSMSLPFISPAPSTHYPDAPPRFGPADYPDIAARWQGLHQSAGLHSRRVSPGPAQRLQPGGLLPASVAEPYRDHAAP